MLASKLKQQLSIEGKEVLRVLMTEFNMLEADALKLIVQGGLPLAIAILNRRKV
jgi:hypothetical protein